MKLWQLFILLISASFIIISCSNHGTNETGRVNNIIYKLIEADNHSDIEAVLRSYTDSIEFYPAGKPFTKGIATIRKSYEKLFKENRLSIQTTILQTKIVEDNAIVTGINRGSVTSLTDSSINQLNDKYIAIMVRTANNEWKIDKLIWGIYQ